MTTESEPIQSLTNSSKTDVAETPKKARGKSLRPLVALKGYILRYRLMVVAALLSLLISASAMLVLPLGVRRMIDHGFSANNATFIDQYFEMMIVIGCVLAIASAARFFFVNWIGERVVADLRADVFNHLTLLSPAFYEGTHSGEVMSRLTADTTQIKTAVGSAASQALRNMVMLTGAVFMMIFTSPKLSVLVLIAIPLIVLPLVGYGRLVRSLSRRAQDTLADASAFASENLSAIRTMQAFTSEKVVASRFGRAVNLAFDAAKARLRARAGLTAIAIFLVFASVVGVLWYGSHEVLAGTMTSGRLSQFVLYSIFAAGAMGELSEVWGEVQQAAGAAERLTELMEIEPSVKSPKNPIPLPSPPIGEVEFRDVSFSYPTRPDQKALDAVSLKINPGETVAIVGASGAGKSSLFNLLLRFYDPDAGELLVDGVPINECSLKDLRKHFAVVPQETALFADTIAENIRYGSPRAADSQVFKAAEAALAHEFIKELPDGYETLLGEKGFTLSGGQRQRIAIARAILKDAPILLLDEATSALDSESEKLVQTALEHVMEGRTTIVIAHRLATVQRADRILVMDQGAIVEKGTHSSLVKTGGIYSRLAELQFAATSLT